MPAIGIMIGLANSGQGGGAPVVPGQISPSFLAAASQVFAPVVTPGPITVSPSLLAAGGTIYSPTVTVAVTYDTDAAAYFVRMATDPGATRKGHINTLVLALKSAGSYAKFDFIHLLASHEASTGLLNIKSATWPLSATNSPAFTTDRGYAGDDVSAYLRVNGYDQSVSAGKQWAQNSACVGIYVNSHPSATTLSSDPIIGSGGADSGPRLLAFSAANTAQGRINNGSGVNATTNVNTHLGWQAMSRIISASIDIYRSSTAITVTATSAAVNGTVINLFNQSNSLFAPGRVAVMFGGAGLTTTEMAATMSAFDTYLAAIGAN